MRARCPYPRATDLLSAKRLEQRARFGLAVATVAAARERFEFAHGLDASVQAHQGQRAVVTRLRREAAAGSRAQVRVPRAQRARRIVLDEMQPMSWGAGRFPWGNEAYNSTLAVHRRSYFWPAPIDGSPDQAYHVAAPGRRPAGNGPLGHSDMAGLMLEQGAGNPTIYGGSFEGHAIEEFAEATSFAINRKYWAIGGRCARDVPAP